MADANDVSFNLLPDEERPYNSNWDKTFKETFRATERDNQGWSDLGATGLQARENGRGDARNGPDLHDQGSSRSQSREIERGVTPENGPIGTADDHNPYGFLSLGATKAPPIGMKADNQALDKLRASRRQADLKSSNRPDDLRASRQAGVGRASRKDNLRETNSKTSGPSVDRKSQGRSDFSASGKNVASSGRGLRRTEIEPMRQTVLSTVTERTEDDVIRRTRESAIPARDPDNPDWKTMIVEENYLWDWKNMFNKMKPRWSTRESLAHSSVTRSWKTYDDDTIDDASSSSGTSGTDVTIMSSATRKRLIVAIVVAVAIVMLIGAIVPAVVLSNSSGSGNDVHRKIDLLLTILSLNYTAALENKTSDDYLNFINDFCNAIEDKTGSGLSQHTFVGCEISNIRKGSVIVYFSLFLKMSTKQAVLSDTEVKVALGLAPTKEQQVIVTLGGFEINATSVKVLQNSVVITQDNVIPNQISFNGTCKSNDRCVTSLARCLTNVCACSNDKYYNATSNACLPIDCGDVTDVVNAATRHQNSSFGDHLNITCKNGYEIEANKTHATLTCSRHGSWGELPRCNPVICPEFNLPPNTTSLESRVNKTFGDVISYSCQAGFEMAGNQSSVKCQANKTWTQGSGCQIVRCPEFVLPPNTTSNESRINRMFEDVISYACQDGFEMTGNESSVKCQANKTWSQGSQCRPIKCVAFDLPPNTTSNDTRTNRTLGGSVSYTCVEGFELNGNDSTVKCQANKTWSKGSECLRVVCPEFHLPSNTTSNESRVNKTFGDVIYYTCQVGFEMVGNQSSVKCQSNKTWTQGSECQIVRCQEFVLPPYTTSNEPRINRTFGDVISYTCHDDFELTGNDSSVKCQANKTWSQGSECRPIKCVAFDLPPNTTSNDTLTNRTLGESVSYTCVEGFELNGNESTVKCLTNKTWTKGSECVPVKCSEFSLPSNATSGESRINRTFGDVISYTCQVGFEITGNESSVKCQANKTWSKGSECKIVRCPEFVILPNTTSNEPRINRTFGDVISYTCQFGFEMTGNESSVKCQANKTWSQVSECRPIKCVAFGLPPNTTSNDTLTNRTLGESVSYTCVEGFELNGNESTVKCQANKTWTKGSECVPVKCPEFSLPSNATSDESRINRTFGDVFSYTCNIGFELSDNEASVKCQANKTWSKGSECRHVQCIAFQLPSNATSSDTLRNRTLGESVSYKCIEGFELNGNDSTVKCQANTTWTKGSECLRVTCPVFILPHNTTSNESGENRTFGEVLSYTCQAGFEMDGNETSVRCQANKTWSQGSGCRQAKCNMFELPSNATSSDTLTNHTLGESVSYKCIDGFELNGNESTVKCQANKTWTKGSLCLRVICPEFNLPPNTTSNESRVNKTFGDVISYSCQVGFEMVGNESSVKCQANKTWTQGSGCQIVRCPEFFLLPNSTSNESRINRTFEDVISYTCQDGFERTGNESSVKCQANKTWSQGSQCRPIQCMPFRLPTNTTSTDTLTNRTQGESVSYTCIEGFELNGNESTVKCLSNKTWTKGSECVPVKCPEFSLPSNATSGESRINRTFGDVFSYTCNIGFELSDNEASVKCQANKTWSKGSECRHVQCIAFQLPSNATSSDTLRNRTLGASVSYKCIEGFELNGNDSTVKCQANKTWTKGSECLRVTCPVFILPHNTTSNESGENRTFGEVLSYTCQAGFEMDGNETSVRCQANKTWSQGSGCRHAKCNVFELPSNATSSDTLTNRTLGESVSYKCIDGFELNGNESTVKCQANKTWTKGSLCLRVICPEFNLPPNTTSNESRVNKTFGDVISYSCQVGFEMVGNESSVKCQANKTWTQGSGCQIVQCPEFFLLPNSTSNESRINRTFGDVISYTCQDSFERTGNESSVKCQANKTWSQGSQCRPIQCMPFQLPTNTTSTDTLTNRTLGESVSYTCIEGFELNGNDSTVKCQANKTWTIGSECLRVTCPVFILPQNTTSNDSGANRTFGDVLSYMCLAGFEIDGNETSVRCQANKTWSQGSGCRHVKCNVFELPPNATSSDTLTNRTLGESVSYKCIEGFELNGNESTVKCQANKTWTKGSLCLRVICPEFVLPPNTTSNESRVNKTFGDVISYSCQVGFEMAGNELNVKCQANKTWTQGSGCQIVRCPEFVLLPNSTSNESRINRTFGDVISYTCEVGFERTGNESIVKCQANKTWSQGSQCRPIMCMPFQLPTNTTSTDTLTNRTIGESVSYTCIEGFELNGNDSTVKCEANKTWTKGSECQRVKCLEFVLLPNSTSNESRINRSFGDVISYTCLAGFEMTGNESSVRCQANRTWSQGSECRPFRCPEFSLPLNSIFNGSRMNRTFGEVIAYTCQPGFEMAENYSSVVCQANKTWSRGLDCLPVQCPAVSLPTYSTSNASLTNRTYGSMITYSCQAGYELNGTISSIMCQANRTWTHSSSCEPVQCQVFKLPNNSIPGQPITDNLTFTYGTTISFSCIEGYEGGGSVTCLANKSWSSAEICIPKRCDAYNPPAYASVIGNTRPDNLTFGETLNITCNTGYLSNNETAVTVHCSANGTWLPIIKCEPRTCPNFTAPANTSIGNQVLFGRIYRATINVTCNDGFNQVGNTNVICGEDGTWSPSPSCIQCSGLNIPNATVLYQTSKNASISCIQGFNLNGPAIVFCHDDGNWTEAPRCVPVNCSNPSDPPYGTLNYTSTLLGARAYLTCGDGFQLNGRAYLECAVDGRWNQTGTCEPRDCGNFSMPEHSTVVANGGTKVNATIIFNCTERFTLATNSSNTLTCSSNGSWIGYVECVSTVCEMFLTPNHSILLNTTTSGLVVGVTLIIECKFGYSLQGSDRITCLPNSSWTPIPQCIPIDCGVLQDPDNGFANVGNTTVGSNVTLECDEGFKFVGSNRSICETTGNWSRHGRCEIVDCYNYTVPNNCNVSKSYATTFNSTITVNGINGYVISENSTDEVVCDANGLWSGYVACVRNECGMFQVPANATVLNSTSERYYFGDGVIVNCTKGFVSENDGIVKCLANGTWTALPTCTRINCGEFKVLPNGIVNGSSTFVDSVVLVGCTEGYNLIGSNTSTCLATGNWSQHGTCQMVDCGNYTVPDNCTIQGSYNTTFNSSVRVAGIEGFKLANNDSGQIVCAANGTWSRYVACVRKECTTFVAPPNAEQKNASVYFYGDNINITCLMGYTLVGNAVVRCQADGKWTQIPTCTKAACNPIIIEHANISFNQDYSNATVACFDNYAVVGSSQLTCQSNGNWTDIPSCNLMHCPKLSLPDNGVLNSSKSEIGTSVSMDCATGYEPDGDSIITCLRNGSWSSNITCIPVDCGKYDEGNNRKFTLTNGTTTFNSSREVTCAAGLAHTADSTTSVICAANGSWVGTPNCSIPGSIAFSKSDYVFTIGEEGKIICSVTQYPNWQIVRIMTGTVNEQVSVFNLSNQTGVVRNTSYNQGRTSFILRSDGLDIDVNLNPVNCSDEGIYFGVLVVGDNVDVKDTNTEIRLRANSSKPQIVVPDQILAGRDFIITCSGNVGRNTSGLFGRILLEGNINATGPFTVIDGTNYTKCNSYTTLTATVAVEPGTANVEYRCTIVDPEGMTLYSQTINRPVNNSFVAFEHSSYTFTVGENANLTCGVANTPDWAEIYIGRASEQPFASVSKGSNMVRISANQGHISVSNANTVLTEQSANVSLQFNPVLCNDTAGSMATHNYVCSVKLNDSTWQNATTEIIFQRFPEIPRLTLSREIIHNKFTLADRPFICEGQIGLPSGKLVVESDFEDEFKTFLTLENPNNTIGIIFKNETISEPCGRYQKLYFAFHKANDSMNLRRFRCSILPALGVIGSDVKMSDEGVIKVIPNTWCSNVNTSKIIEHPYFCHIGVKCNSDGTIGVPQGCSDNECFNINSSGCSNCTCAKQGPTTTTTTTPSPYDERIECRPMSVAEYSGGRLTVSCTLFNVDTIRVLNISKDRILVDSIQNPTNQTAVSNINIVISPSFIQLTITMTNCSVEGSYTVTINNGTSGSFTTWLLVNATSPLMTVALNKWLNQPFTITCRGNVGRLIGGSYMSKLYIQWDGQLKKENLYRVASPPICNNECQCSETIEIAITANETWNNTEVRCIALDKNDTVIAASDSETIILAESVTEFTSNTTAVFGQEKILECRLRGIANFTQGSAVIKRTSEGLVCSVNSSLVGMCTKATGYSATGTIDGDTLVVRLLIANVSCNDSGEYTCSLQQNPEAKAVTTLNIERLPEVPRLTMSREIIHNKFTLDDRPFICEGQLGVPAGNLSIESDFQDEFKPFLDINNRNNSIGFIFKEETIADACGTYQKLYFAFHKADVTMNLRRFRCSIKPSESLANQNVKLSGVGTIKVVPDTWCQNVTSVRVIEHPYLCHVGVSCDAKGAILGVPLGCIETQCFNVSAQTACPECTCNKQGPVTTTTTTVSPDAEQMYCTPQSVGNVRGERVSVYCTLLNVNAILQLNVSKDGRTIRSEINASGMVQVAFPEISLMISETSINITLIMTNCSVEDSYTISINNGTTGTFTTWLTENATSPSMSVAPNKWLNQPFSINCTGNVGRISGGAYRSKLYIQWGSQFQKDKLYGGVNPPICNDACQCTETIEIAITANGTWNNTEVRCIAVDNNDTIVYASGSETVVLSESVVSFTSNTTAIVGKEKIVECRLKGIFNSAQDIAIITRSTGDLVCEFNGELQGNCSTLTGYSVSGYRDGDTLLMRLNIANTSCNDSGEYVCSSESITGAQAKTTLSVQRLSEIPQLTMSREIIHNKSTRADLPFICEGQLGVPPGKLSIEIDIQNEFETFLDLKNNTNSIAWIFKEETIPESCGTYQKLYFGFHKANVTMNLRKFRCSLKPSLELPNGDVKYSKEGVIKVVSDTWCENMNELKIIEHPYLCHVGVSCDGKGGIAGVPTLCNETQCRNFTTFLCTECVCDKKGPTIVTTTTLSPDAQQIHCNSTSIARYIGELVSVSCMLINVDTVNELNVSKDGGSLYFQSNPGTSVVVNQDMSLMLSKTNINVTLSFTNCTIEGWYTISINNGTSAMFQVWLIEEPKVPTLTKPTTVWLNQPFEITCNGNVGRTTGGNARSSLYIEVIKVAEALVTHSGQPSNCSEQCSCAGSATIRQTADQSWNNSEVRCVAKNASGIILSSSDSTMIQLSNTVVNFISNNSAKIGEAKVIECVIQGDALNGGAKITRRMDGMVCTINSQYTGNCSNPSGYSVSGVVDGTSLRVSLTIRSVGCSDEGEYDCHSVNRPDAYATSFLALTADVSILTLTMPSKAIENQKLPFDDILKCEGNMGYPAQELRLEVYDNTTNSYKTFSWPSGWKNNQTIQAGCLTTGNFSYHNLIFNLADSGKLFRCSAYDRSPTPRFITSTSPQSLNVQANTCNSTGYYWEGSPSSCQLYTICVSGEKIISDCGAGKCYSIVDGVLLSCQAANCNNCTLI